MPRLNWSNRQGPGEFDVSAPEVEHFDFDHHRNATPGGTSWPKGFGPKTIGDAWRNGLVVVAEIEGYPHPVAAVESRWGDAKVLQVRVPEGWRIPERVYTRASIKGLSSTGEVTK